MSDVATLFERACRGERGARPPVWIMRQAGRYLPEYRALRERVDFLTATTTPDLAAEVTLQPMRRFDLDAAILFADIMTPLEGMGVDIRFEPGPVIERPVRSPQDARNLRALDPEESVPFVCEALRLVRAELHSERALIAFAGAPFTLLCYLVEGSGSKDFMEARRFLAAEPEAAHALLDLLAVSMARYLVAQARAGADALMLFDSWAGLLPPPTYRRFVLPAVRRVIDDVRAAVDRPVVYYASGCATLASAFAETGADVFGVDWSIPLSRAVEALGADRVVQGNLDPAALFAPTDALGSAIDAVVEGGLTARSHIFNLGHGVHRATDPDRIAFLVDRVRGAAVEVGARSGAGE